MPSKKELQQRVKEVEAENQDLCDQLDAIADIVGTDDEDEDEDEGEEEDEPGN